MYAIFRAKGKQFRAEPDATLRIPSLDAEPGERVTFDEVLLATRDGEVSVGTPALDGASVQVEVVRHGKGDKIVVYKMKRRKGYRRKQGHRQKFTEVRIVGIDLPGGAARAEPKQEEPAEAEPAARTEAEEPEPVSATDAAAELAAEHGLDLEEIEGSGEGGRILKSDVEARVGDLEEDETAAEPEGEPQPEPDVEVLEATDAARELADEHGLDLAEVEGSGEGGRILKGDVEEALQPEATDAARELADEEGLDLEEVEGTGEGGRILKGDVEDAIRARDEGDEA